MTTSYTYCIRRIENLRCLKESEFTRTIMKYCCRASLPHPYVWSSQRNFSFSLFIRCFYSSTEASHSFHKSATIRTFSTTCSGCVQHGRSPCHSLAKFWTRVYCRSFLRWSRALFWSSRNLERSPTNRSIQAPLNNRG
jgi:hypothetical protein